MKFSAVAVSLVISLAGCASPPSSEARPGVAFIALERSGCFGSCPSYVLTVFEDGVVRFEGRDFVKRRGIFLSRAPSSAVHALFAKVEAIGFWDMPNDFSGTREVVRDGQTVLELAPTDHPSRFVTVEMGGRKKTIRDYWNAPASLRDLEKSIDRVGDAEKWVGRSTAEVPNK